MVKYFKFFPSYYFWHRRYDVVADIIVTNYRQPQTTSHCRLKLRCKNSSQLWTIHKWKIYTNIECIIGVIYRIYMYKSLIILYLKTFSLVKRTSHLLLFYYLLIFLVILKPIQKSLFLITRILQRRFGIRNKPQFYGQNIKRVDILLVWFSVATNYKNSCITIWIGKLSLIILVSIEKYRYFWFVWKEIGTWYCTKYSYSRV